MRFWGCCLQGTASNCVSWDAIHWTCTHSILDIFSPYIVHDLKIFDRVYQSIKSWNNWNSFSSRLGPHYPSRRPHLSVQKVSRKSKSFEKKRGRLVSLMFSTKILILFTPAISYTHLLYPRITFLYHIFLLSFPYAFTHNSHHYLFWNDNNWHHCLWKEKKMCIIFEEKISNIIAWWKKN